MTAPSKGLFSRIAARAGALSLTALAGMYVLAYLGVEILVDNPVRLYTFCVFLSLSGIYFSWLLGGRRSMLHVAFFNLFFVGVFSKMLWDHGIIIYGAQLFLAPSFLFIYASAVCLMALIARKKSPADARAESQLCAVEEARQRQHTLEFMVASNKLKQDLLARANSVKDELQLLEGVWRSNIHNIINDLPALKERELYREIIEPFEENIIRHLRDLELHLTFDLTETSLADLHAFLREKLTHHGRPGSAVHEIELLDRGWGGCGERVLVDRNKLWDMVMNIIRNSQAALDYRRIDALRQGAGGRIIPHICIAAGLSDRQAHLRITDNGGGVSQECARKLYREPVASRKRGRGRPGQGTVFVKFFGERMDIAITAANTSELGERGLAVTLGLPLQPLPGADPERPAP